eukprot:jgi/Astpho2/6690/Aster-05043
MHSFMQILSQYLGPQEAQLYSELQSKAKPLIKLSEETRTKLEAETGDKKLAAVIVRNLRDYIRKHSVGHQIDINNLPEDPPCLLREGKVPQSDYRVALRNERCALSLETKEKPGAVLGMYRGLLVVGDYVDEAYTDLDHDVPHWFSQGNTDEKEARLLWKQAVDSYGADIEYGELPEEFREKVMQDCNSSVMISAYGYGNETALINDPAPDPMSGAAQDADRLCSCVFVPAWVGNWPFMLVARIRPGGYILFCGLQSSAHKLNAEPSLTYGSGFWSAAKGHQRKIRKHRRDRQERQLRLPSALSGAQLEAASRVNVEAAEPADDAQNSSPAVRDGPVQNAVGGQESCMPKMAVVSKAFELCFCVIAADDCESAWIADLHLQAVSHLDVASKQSSGDADVQDDGVEARHPAEIPPTAGCKRKLGDRDPQGLQLEQVQPENCPNGQLVPSAYGTADAIWALPQQNDWSQVELAVEPGFLDFLCEP